MKQMLAVIAALVALTGTSLGAIQYFATQSELDLVSMRLDKKIQADDIRNIQQRMWDLEDRNWPYPNPAEWKNKNDKDEYRRLELRLRELGGGAR